MKGSLSIKETTINFVITKHARAKRVSMKIRNGKLSVTIPKHTPYKVGELFLKANRAWLLKNVELLTQKPKNDPGINPENIPLLKVRTRNLVRERIEYFNQFYQFSFNRITVRDQKTRWGSCSSNKTLSFNFRLVLLPPELADYIIVHELCHLKQMNHSNKFWELVAKRIPDYPILRKKLRHYEGELM